MLIYEDVDPTDRGIEHDEAISILMSSMRA